MNQINQTQWRQGGGHKTSEFGVITNYLARFLLQTVKIKEIGPRGHTPPAPPGSTNEMCITQDRIPATVSTKTRSVDG